MLHPFASGFIIVAFTEYKFLEFGKDSLHFKEMWYILILKMLKYHTLDGKLKNMLKTIR